MSQYIRSWDDIEQAMREVQIAKCIALLQPLYQVWSTRLAQHSRNRSLFTLQELRTQAKREATRYQTAKEKCACKQT